MKSKVVIFFISFALLYACAPPANRVNPKELRARMDLATSFLLKGKPRVSLSYLLPIKEKVKNYPDYHFLLGLVYFQMKEFSLAKDEFERVIKITPNYGEAWNNLGLCYTELKKENEAKSCFEKAISIPTYLTPEYPAYNLAKLFYNKKRYEEAKVYLKKSIEFNWRYIPSYMLLAKIYEEENNITMSVKTLERASEAAPDDVNILLRLAEGYLKEGKKEMAISLFNRIVKEFPRSHASKVARDYLVILQ